MQHDRDDARPAQPGATARPGSGHATADMAVEAHPRPEDHRADAPASRPADPMPADKEYDQLGEKVASAESRQEALLDEAIEETFPGSDPISPSHID